MKTITEDLAARLAMLSNRYAVAFHPFIATMPTEEIVLRLAERLEIGMEEGVADDIARVRAIVDPGDLARPEFWGTELGRLLFVSGGYVEETCTQTLAAAVLGCSRQWVNAMAAGGRLTSATGQGVYAAEVRGVLQRQAERLRVQAQRRAEIDKTVK